MQKGKVYIMGVGPGDHKLITVKAAEIIAKAEVVVYDRLIGTKILEFANKDAELIYVGKMPDFHAVHQEGINEILIKKALEGKTVARIKGGDPFVFGRGGEEAESLYEEGIEFEIIPGITSAIAVPAYAGIPVTHRDFCSSLHIITGHERPDKEDSLVNYELLAKLEGTLVFLMGIKNLVGISSDLIKHGKNPLTPAAVIEKGTSLSQRVVIGTLKDIAARALSEGIKSPAVTVIGEVVSLHDKLKWFSKGILAGKKIVVTRSRAQAGILTQKLEELGAEVIEFPTIKILEPEDFKQFDSTLNGLNEFNWLVFTSVNGVSSFFKRMKNNKIDIRALAGIKLCAVGAATEEELNKLGLNVEYVPENFTTANLLNGLTKLIKTGEKVLLARADIANPELYNGLRAKNIEVEELTVYRTAVDTNNKEEALTLFKESQIDYITFTSSSTVRNFVKIVGKESLELIKNTKIVCIGPVTADTAKELALNVTATADVFTIDGLVKKLLEV